MTFSYVEKHTKYMLTQILPRGTKKLDLKALIISPGENVVNIIIIIPIHQHRYITKGKIVAVSQVCSVGLKMITFQKRSRQHTI